MLPAFQENIDRSAIDRLVASGMAESQRLEYKEKLPGQLPRDRSEFLADVAAFANSSGGDLVFGIVERRDGDGKPTGIPELARGLGAVNADAECLRMESIVRDGIAPRIPIKMALVDGFPDGPVIVVRIPRTGTGPHMVIFERHNRFYGRSNAGKFLLGIDDIRAGFAASADSINRTLRLRDDRIAAVVSGETPSRVNGAALHVLIVPENTASGTLPFDPRSVGLGRVPLPISGAANGGWVAEGIVARADAGYTLVMRNGVIETVHDFSRMRLSAERPISLLWMEREIVRFIRRSLELLRTIEVPPPYLVLVAFIGVRGHPVAIPADVGGGAYCARQFDRDLLILPNVELQTADQASIAAAMQPMFDVMWQAVGEWCDPNYGNGESAKW